LFRMYPPYGGIFKILYIQTRLSSEANLSRTIHYQATQETNTAEELTYYCQSGTGTPWICPMSHRPQAWHLLSVDQRIPSGTAVHCTSDIQTFEKPVPPSSTLLDSCSPSTDMPTPIQHKSVDKLRKNKEI